MGLRPPRRALHLAAWPGAVGQPRGRIEHVPHVLGVGLPVGGQVQAPARAQLAHQQRGQLRLHQPALVVALLVPGVGEVDADLVQRAIGDFMPQHLDRVVVVEADVVAAVFGQGIEQPAHARGVDFQPDVVARRVLAGGKTQRLAVAEADLQHLRRAAAERRIQVAQAAGVVQAKARPGLVEGTLLGRGEAALAQHEAADLAAAFAGGVGLGRGLGAVALERVGHRRIS